MKKIMMTMAAAAMLMAALTGCATNQQKSKTEDFVGIEEAKQFALSASKVASADATFTATELRERDGASYYQVEFTAGGNAYTYAVDAMSGAVIESNSEPVADMTKTPADALDDAEAKTIALEHAGVAESEISMMWVKRDNENGTAVYEVEFYVAATQTEYDYEIDATTGEIRSFDSDMEHATPQQSTPSTTTSGDQISESEAKTIALEHAGVAESETSMMWVERDNENGTAVYEVEFYVAATQTEYDYEIDATTGEIRGFDSDMEHATPQQSTPSTTTSSGQITESEAKAAALEHAGVAEGDVSWIWAELDRDDGVAVYEVEFYVAATQTEYDYEIDATTGTVRSYDFDAEHHTAESSGGTAKTEQEVREIALARVPGATEQNIRMEADHDDGRLLYEGEIIYDGMQYEFEIDAYSGAILEWDAESIHD